MAARAEGEEVMKTIKFTNGEAVALLHRMESWDCFVQVFADTDGLEHLADLAPERCEFFARSLLQGRTVLVDEASEVDREVLKEAIEGSTWVAVNDPDNDTGNTNQRMTGAYYALVHAAKKIADAFGIPKEDIEVPRH
jgi:hypothetical protein